MFVSIRDTKGQGSAALYARLRNGSGQFWNFTSHAWVDPEESACRVFLVEDPDTDPVTSRYQNTIVLPSNAAIVEYVALSSGEVLGEDQIAAESANTTVLVLGSNSPSSRTADPPQSELPRSNTQLDDFVNVVRGFMRDYPELNRLVAGEESSNRQIVWAIIDTLDDFNTTPPFTRFQLGDFPSRSMLLRGVVSTLLESIGLLQTRNHLQFSDGGIQVGINDKTPFLQAWIQLFRAKYEDSKLKLKVAYNIESAWGGGIHSEFRFINNFYGEW